MRQQTKRMGGAMLWFNADKGYGFIETDDGERLYVAHDGFLPDHEPPQRCKGRRVTFERELANDEPRAVNVSFVPEADQRRARLHRSGGGRSL